MQLFYLTLTSLLSTALALPASPAELVPRACSTRSPTIYRISSAAPNDSPSTNTIEVQRIGPPYQNSVATLVYFTGFPDGATGCQLKYRIPASTTPIATANPDYSSAFQTDVWLLKTGRLPSWNNPPAHTQMVGTIQWSTKPTTTDFETILWAGNCPSNNVPRDGPYAQTMSFSVEGSNWQQLAGGVQLGQSATSGFSMIYNC